MALEVGSRLGHYDVTALIGEGGMGQVYQATDTKLNRQVALKILPEAFATDPDRLARFQREAQVLASLNHPGIAAIYGIEETDDTRALVLELVEGPTLADRIAQGPIPVDEALPIAKQIAEALEAAHEQGIIHRDLKPANIKVRPDGAVKVLDFGLAKALQGDGSDPSESPTITAAATAAGVILGTAAYMSPEQARGKPVDKRADIWAFGAVLYEILTGQRPFKGRDVSEVLGSVLRLEPDWDALPGDGPSHLGALLKRCLEKEPKDRYHDIADVRLDLQRPAVDAAGGQTDAAPAILPAPRRSLGPWVAAVLSGLAGAAAGWSLRQVQTPPTARLVVPIPGVDRLGPGEPALSPDGRFLAYAWGPAGARTLSLHQLDDPEGEAILEVEDGRQPFFSPDSVWLGFFTATELRKVSVRGGPPQTLATTPVPRGGTWGADGWIVFAPQSRGGLWRVSADGGTPENLTTPDPAAGETSHRGPVWVAGANAVTFTALREQLGPVVMALSLDTGEQRQLVDGGTSARYVPTGHLVYLQEGALMAVPFDADRLEPTGSGVPVIEAEPEAGVQGVNGRVAVSESGLLVYPSGTLDPPTLVWVDRDGIPTQLGVEPRGYQHPRLSPDGRQVVVAVGQTLWLHTLGAAATFSRLTFQTSGDWPVWTPESDRVVYSTRNPGTTWDLVWQAADGSGAAEPLVVRELEQYVMGGMSPDGRTLAFVENHPETTQDIWLVSTEDRTARVFLQTPASEHGATFSPDGRFVAYISDELGDDEVFVRPVSGDAGQRQVSYGGGTEPLWAPSGELFYRNRREMVVVEVTTDPDLMVGTPEILFQGPYVLSSVLGRNYDVTRDGQRILMIQPPDPSDSTARLNAVVNWFQELNRLAPTD